MPVPEKRKQDRRIQKTEALLRGALGALIREKPYEDIVVKEILNRANVGRSTFYTHFADKDELLLSCIHDLLLPAQLGGRGRATAEPRENIVWFSLPILEHIERHRRTGQATMGPRGRREMHEHLQHAIRELIQDEVRTALRRSSRTARQASPDLLVRWIASTFVLVLNWWVESDTLLPARETDGLFRALIEPSLAEALR
jgi:AcrR family transcriptional regulator